MVRVRMYEYTSMQVYPHSSYFKNGKYEDGFLRAFKIMYI